MKKLVIIVLIALMPFISGCWTTVNYAGAILSGALQGLAARRSNQPLPAYYPVQNPYSYSEQTPQHNYQYDYDLDEALIPQPRDTQYGYTYSPYATNSFDDVTRQTPSGYNYTPYQGYDLNDVYRDTPFGHNYGP